MTTEQLAKDLDAEFRKRRHYGVNSLKIAEALPREPGRLLLAHYAHSDRCVLIATNKVVAIVEAKRLGATRLVTSAPYVQINSVNAIQRSIGNSTFTDVELSVAGQRHSYTVGQAYATAEYGYNPVRERDPSQDMHEMIASQFVALIQAGCEAAQPQPHQGPQASIQPQLEFIQRIADRLGSIPSLMAWGQLPTTAQVSVAKDAVLEEFGGDLQILARVVDEALQAVLGMLGEGKLGSFFTIGDGMGQPHDFDPDSEAGRSDCGQLGNLAMMLLAERPEFKPRSRPITEMCQTVPEINLDLAAWYGLALGRLSRRAAEQSQPIRQTVSVCNAAGCNLAPLQGREMCGMHLGS